MGAIAQTNQDQAQQEGAKVVNAPSVSPGGRLWQRFRANRLGFYSLCLLLSMMFVSFAAEWISNDRPLLLRYEGAWYFPVFEDVSDKALGGDFETPADFQDPFILQQVSQPGNFVFFAPNHYGYQTLNYFASQPNPAPPSAANWLGTDRQGRDMLAQLIYGFRVSILFGLALTAIGVVVGILAGSVQGYFAGKVDLIGQRIIEIWEAMPALYLLIIFASIFVPSVGLLLILLSLFSWMGIAAYVRAEFLRNRKLDYVRSAQAMGVSHWQRIRRHILPNSLMPVIALLPFNVSAAILSLTSLDFLGLGVPPQTPSLGRLLNQGKESLDAWWISLPTFVVLALTLLLLTLTADALRNALDPRYQPEIKRRKRPVQSSQPSQDAV